MKKFMMTNLVTSAIGALALAASAQAQTFSASGANAAGIQTTVDQFRAGLGANNGVGGSFASGRREINWDAVPDTFSSPNNLPGNFFNANSPRGLTMTTPGTSFRLSADSSNPTNTPTLFTDLDPVIAGNFSTFSPQRLFTQLGSTITDVRFFIPGTNSPATVLGFGSVFTDVEFENTTRIELFDINDEAIGSVFAPTSTSAGLSFIGVIRNQADIARVRITSGSAALDSGLGANEDFVAMDDFIYGEPVPAPGAAAVMGLGALFASRRRRA